MSEEAEADPQSDRAARPAPPEAAGARGADEPRQIRLKPGAIAGGAVLAYIVSVALGIVMARSGIGNDLYLFPLALFIAVYTGGFFAGRWAGTSGFINGVAVAVLGIVAWAIQNAMIEAQLVEIAGPAALPRMNMGGIVLGDLLFLTAGGFGGWMSERRR